MPAAKRKNHACILALLPMLLFLLAAMAATAPARGAVEHRAWENSAGNAQPLHFQPPQLLEAQQVKVPFRYYDVPGCANAAESGAATGKPTTTRLSVGKDAFTEVIVGGDGTASRISPEQARAIQDFASRYKVEVTVVGSRVNPGKAIKPGESDWDYLINKSEGIQPSKSLRDVAKSASNYLPKQRPRTDEFGNTRSGLDIWREPVDVSRPYVTFKPQANSQ
jgi:hypothetical protein